jgi:hypothetical protein
LVKKRTLCRLSGGKKGEKIDKRKIYGGEERKKRTQDSRKVKMIYLFIFIFKGGGLRFKTGPSGRIYKKCFRIVLVNYSLSKLRDFLFF